MNKKGRPLGAEGKRVRIPGVIISSRTKMFLNAWREHYGIPHGRVIDCMVDQLVKSESFKLSKIGCRKSLVKSQLT